MHQNASTKPASDSVNRTHVLVLNIVCNRMAIPNYFNNLGFMIIYSDQKLKFIFLEVLAEL